MAGNRTLKASVVIGGAMSGTFRAALSDTKTGLKKIGDEILNVERRQRLLSNGIDAFGARSPKVAAMRKEYAALAEQADRLHAARERLAKADARIAENIARRQQLGGQLRGATAQFGAVVATTFLPIREAVSFENAMLAVAKQVEGARDAGGNLTPVYYAMRKQIQHLGREIPIATNDLAAMAAAGARMGVARDELMGFVRTSAMMADAFEMPADELADNMGKIAGLFAIPIPKIGDLADAINYLDDKAISKGGEIIDVMRRIGGMAQTMKMPAKEAAALGSTFLTLGSSAEVAGTASNAVLRILGAATAQSKRVRKGLADIGFDPAAVQSSMAKDATGTILSVLDKLNSLSDEQRMVATTRIFGAEYGDDMAKLATGAAEYRRQLALVNGEQAKGSMAREFQARLKTTSAQWEITKNRMKEAAVAIGNALLPAVGRLMETIGPMVEGFAEWATGNPGVVKGVIGTALALTGLRVATLGVAYAWTAVKGPVLSVMSFIARWRAAGTLAEMGRFGAIAMRVAGAVRWVATGLAAIGGGPVAAAVAVLAAGALIVRKYWQPIKAFLGGMFDGIRQAVGPAMAEIAAAFAPLRPVWDGISSAIGKVWDWFVKLIEPVNMTSEQLKSAANAGRTFGAILGAVISNGLRGFAALVRVIGWVIGKAATINGIVAKIPVIGSGARMAQDLFSGGGKAPGGAAPAAPRGKAPPKVPAPSARAGAAGKAAGDSHVYHITQQPGESGEALAKRIEAERRQREARERRASLADIAG